MKHEWRKHEKDFDIPKNKPAVIELPAFSFFTIEGAGNPNDEFFAEFIGVLYSLEYTVKMSLKKGLEPESYYEYTVYPLEGVWDIRISKAHREIYITDVRKVAPEKQKTVLRFKVN